jgi:AcrR family transcriptional regulator
MIPQNVAYDPSSTRERILLEASRLFAARGYHRTSTRDIARAVGIQQPSVFHHFPTKKAIMADLLGLNFDRAVAFATAMLTKPGTPSARLYRVLREDLRWVMTVPYDLSGTQGDDVIRDPAFKRWAEKQVMLNEAWRVLVEEGIRNGEFVPYDSVMVTRVIGGVFREVIRAAARHVPDEDVPSADEVAQFMLRALLVDPSDVDRVVVEADELESADMTA